MVIELFQEAERKKERKNYARGRGLRREDAHRIPTP
jgi:hypothetical protein